MGVFNTRIAALAVLALGFADLAFAADILIADAKSQPESLTVGTRWVSDRRQRQHSVRLQGARGLDHCREVRGCQRRRPRHLFLRHAGRCRHEHVVDVSANPGAGHHAGAASHRSEGLRSLHRRARSSAGTCPATTVRATISRSDRTRRFTSPTPPTARSTSCRPVLPLPNYSWRIARSMASMGSLF